MGRALCVAVILASVVVCATFVLFPPFVLSPVGFPTASQPCNNNNLSHEISERLERALRDSEEALAGALKTELVSIFRDHAFPSSSSTPPPPDWTTPKAPLLPCPSADGGYVTVGRMQAGLGDRLKATVNAYVLALLAGRGLAVSDDLLFDNAHSLDHGVCRWRTGAHKDARPGRWELRVINTRDEGPFYHKDFRSHQDAGVWDVESNMIFSDELLLNPDFASSPPRPALFGAHRRGKLFHLALRSLFARSERMEEELRAELARQDPEGTRFLIGFHIRAGDWKIGARRRRRSQVYNQLEEGAGEEGARFRTTHPHEYRMAPDASYPCFVMEGIALWDELSPEERERYPGGPLFFVSSDYLGGARRLVDLLRQAGYPAFESGRGAVRHMEGGGDHSRTYFDWWMLTRARRLVITVSGYSETAAKYHCVPTSFFVNHPTLKNHNNFTPRKCVHHFIRMRGDGLCVPEADDDFLFEYTYYRYQ